MLFHFMLKRGKGDINPETGILCFSAEGIPSLPKRTRGRIVRKDGKMVFVYKTLPLMPQKELVLEDFNHLFLVEDPLYPVLDEKEDGWGTTWFIFTPAYQNKEAELAKILECQQGTSAILKGFNAAVSYIKKLFGKSESAETLQPS